MIKIPKQFMGVSVNGAMEKALEGKLSHSVDPKQTNPQTNTLNLEGYIHVPSVNLYFAKEKILLGKNWSNCHKELQNQGLKMPTIPQFIEFLKYLKSNASAENTQIYKDITEVRDPWRGEWLDADFKVKNKQLYINYNHKFDSKGNLIPQNSEQLENCLMEDCYADILNPNKQGLPTKKSKTKEFYYWFPRSDNNSVARFDAGSGGASLDCVRDPDVSLSSLGVRACAVAKK